MANDDFANLVIALCDWRGHVVWTSKIAEPPLIGQFAWSTLTPKSQEICKEIYGKVASLRQAQSLLVENQDGKHFRCWLWPLDTPDIAVCALCREVPSSLADLSEREMECMQLLAQGMTTKEIAEQLDVSTSTLHTHLTRARAKLGVDNLESLISFAARYCYPPTKPLAQDKVA